jgi:hypothetical protein
MPREMAAEIRVTHACHVALAETNGITRMAD